MSGRHSKVPDTSPASGTPKCPKPSGCRATRRLAARAVGSEVAIADPVQERSSTAMSSGTQNGHLWRFNIKPSNAWRHWSFSHPSIRKKIFIVAFGKTVSSKHTQENIMFTAMCISKNTSTWDTETIRKPDVLHLSKTEIPPFNGAPSPAAKDPCVQAVVPAAVEPSRNDSRFCSTLCRSRAQHAWRTPATDWLAHGSRNVLTCHDWPTKHIQRLSCPLTSTTFANPILPRCDLCEHSDVEVYPEAVHKTSPHFVPQGHDPAQLQPGCHTLYRSNNWSSHTCKRQTYFDLMWNAKFLFTVCSELPTLNWIDKVVFYQESPRSSLELKRGRQPERRCVLFYLQDQKVLSKTSAMGHRSLFAHMQMLWFAMCGSTNMACLFPGKTHHQGRKPPVDLSTRVPKRSTRAEPYLSWTP